MARNGSGTYTKVNTFSSGATITAAGHNQNWDDLATEITNSMAADGQTSATAPLKGSNGTAALPTWTFASDPDTGIYRRGANELGFATAGVAAGYFDSAKKLFALGAFDVAGTANFQSTINASGSLTVTSITASGVINGPDGTKTAPGLGFSNDGDTGIYRIGSNNIGISCGDTKIWDITTAGATLTGALTVSSTGTFAATLTASSGFTVSAGAISVPAGSIANAALVSPPVFTASYTSADQTITTAGSLSLTHSLGAKPKVVILWLKNTSTEGNYSVNDEVLVTVEGLVAGTGDHAISVVRTATTVELRFGNIANVFTILNKTTGVGFATTNSKWALIVQAFA